MTSKTAIITGAASGIGKHWADVLLKQGGYQLVLADVNEQGLRGSFSESASLRLHALDIRSKEQWQRVLDDALQRFGRIDYLFNIAGISRQSFFLSQPIENIDLVLDINLKGPLIGMRLVGEQMMKQGAGHIINVGSLSDFESTPSSRDSSVVLLSAILPTSCRMPSVNAVAPAASPVRVARPWHANAHATECRHSVVGSAHKEPFEPARIGWRWPGHDSSCPSGECRASGVHDSASQYANGKPQGRYRNRRDTGTGYAAGLRAGRQTRKGRS